MIYSENILKKIPPAKREKSIKYSNEFILYNEQYDELINNISAENLSYFKSKVNNLEVALFDMLSKTSKDVELVYRLCILLMINYGSDGLVEVSNILLQLYSEEGWYILEPLNEDNEDAEYIKLNMIANLSKKIKRWVNEFIFLDNNNTFNMIYFLQNINDSDTLGELESLARNDKKFFHLVINNIKISIENFKKIEQLISNICASSNNEEVLELYINFSSFIAELNSFSNFSNEIYNNIIMPDLLFETGAISDNLLEVNFSENKKDNLKIVDQIKVNADKLTKQDSTKLLGHAIIYCLENLNVDNMKLMANIKNNNVLAQLVDYLVEMNNDEE